MSSGPQPAPAVRTARLVGTLAALSAAALTVVAVISDGSDYAVVAAVAAAVNAGLWFGRLIEAKAIRTGRNGLSVNESRPLPTRGERRGT